jgi:hypothetical protein
MRAWKREEKMCHVQTNQNVSCFFCLTFSSDSVPVPIIPLSMEMSAPVNLEGMRTGNEIMYAGGLSQDRRVTSFAGSVELAPCPESELGIRGNEIQASM